MEKLLKLRPIAATFLKSELGDGNSTSFWFDNWHNMGCLIDVWKDTRPQQLGIPRNATVLDACDSGG